MRGLPRQTGEINLDPPHEVVLGPLVSVPHTDLQLLALSGVQVHLELLLPPGVEALVHHLGLVSLIGQPGGEMVVVTCQQ